MLYPYVIGKHSQFSMHISLYFCFHLKYRLGKHFLDAFHEARGLCSFSHFAVLHIRQIMMYLVDSLLLKITCECVRVPPCE